MSGLGVVVSIIGGWLVVDGVGSIIFYHKQSTAEQVIRVIRVGLGVGLMYAGWLAGWI